MQTPGTVQQNSGTALSPFCRVAPGNTFTSQVLLPPLKNEDESKCLPKLLQEK